MANEDLQDWIGGEPLDDAAELERVRTAFRRLEAPEGFADRLMARPELRAGAERFSPYGAGNRRRGVLLQFSRPAWRIAYAAAAVLAVAAGSLRVEHARSEQRRVNVAAAQFDTALAVTNHALDHVSARLESTEFGEVQRALEANGGSKE